MEKGVIFIEFSELMGEIDTTPRIMGSQNWWFGDLGTLLESSSPPLEGPMLLRFV